MAASERDDDQVERLAFGLTLYSRVMAGLIMLFGLRQWAIIIGLIPGSGGMFEEMTMAWKIATAHLAVVDLVAAVGLWQRTAWGNVLWIYAALAEVAMHTVFMGTFGSDLPVVGFHVSTVAGFLILVLLAKRAERR